MTRYLKSYIASIEKRLKEASSLAELEEIMREHKDKIAFMQHERIVHFLVTMMFALILTIFMALIVVVTNIPALILVTLIIVLLGFYIKHYYFLENTVQYMYVIYDNILEKMMRLEKGESTID